MTALADQSSMPLVPLPVWCIVGALLFLGVASLIWAEHHSPIVEGETSGLDVLDGVGKPACHSPGPRGGHCYRGVGASWTCQSCGDTVPRGAGVYDQLAPEEVLDVAAQDFADEFPAIELFANGES